MKVCDWCKNVSKDVVFMAQMLDSTRKQAEQESLMELCMKCMEVYFEGVEEGVKKCGVEKD